MFENLEIFRMARALAVRSSARQAEIAANVANADTPGYRAADVLSFATYFEMQASGESLRKTRRGHLGVGINSDSAASAPTRVWLADEASPNGNNVSLESEMRKSVEVQYRHETALSVYETARNILRTSLGRGR